MMNDFNKLHPDIIHTHILPRLDGTTLTVLSSVSSEFRHMISKNNELWKNICTSTWPYLHHWNLNQVISTFPCGYRSFFSDAFPSLHHHHNNSYNFQSQSHCIDLPPTKDLIYAIDLYLQGEPHPMISSVRSQEKTFHSLYTERLYINRSHPNSQYFQENFRLSCIAIDPTGKRAGTLCHSSCKPDSVEESLTTTVLVYKNLQLPGLPDISTEMVKCHVEVTCYEKGSKGLRAEFRMEDMNGKLVLKEHADITVMNAIHNGKRKKLDL